VKVHIPAAVFVALNTVLTFCAASGVLESDFGGGAGALRRVRFGVRGHSSTGDGSVSTRTTIVSSISSSSSSSNIVESLRLALVVRGVLTVFRLLSARGFGYQAKKTELTDNTYRPLALPENNSWHFCVHSKIKRLNFCTDKQQKLNY
jgi:hypothetical protein